MNKILNPKNVINTVFVEHFLTNYHFIAINFVKLLHEKDKGKRTC